MEMVTLSQGKQFKDVNLEYFIKTYTQNGRIRIT
jgi:hypothetical protein